MLEIDIKIKREDCAKKKIISSFSQVKSYMYTPACSVVTSFAIWLEYKFVHEIYVVCINLLTGLVMVT